MPIIAMLLYSISAAAQVPVSADKMPEITFEHDRFDFGTVAYGKPVQHEFVFTNTGKTPLIITDVTASCGCTTPTYSKAPVAPGKTGSVIVTYDTKRVGMADKKVSIISNAKTSPKNLYIKIHVLDGETPKTPNDVASPNPPGSIFDK